MPVTVPVPTKAPGDILTSALWNTYLRDNINKLLNQGHRVLTVAQFTALTGIEDGDEAYVEVDATNGVMWHFRYVNAEPTYKWRYLGGPPLSSYVGTSETTTSATYAALTTAGPSVAIPRAGDYRVDEGFETGNNSALTSVAMSYDIGAIGAVDADRAAAQGPSGVSAYQTSSRSKIKTALTSITLTAKYKATATANFAERAMFVTPIRIRHDA